MNYEKTSKKTHGTWYLHNYHFMYNGNRSMVANGQQLESFVSGNGKQQNRMGILFPRNAIKNTGSHRKRRL